MPQLELNIDALSQNLRNIQRLAKEWHFTYLPVLKMVASHPLVVQFLRERGFTRYASADIYEHPSQTTPEYSTTECVLVNIPPLHKSAEVVRHFARSSFSHKDGFNSINAAATAQRCRHQCLLMLDLGDMREGVPAQAMADTLAAVAPISRQNREGIGAYVAGIGVNMGCLYGACPDDISMQALADSLARACDILGHPLDVLSLGGTIFWNWFADARHRPFPLPQGCRLEFRMGDPLLLGYDIYRGAPLQGADFRTDIFAMSATVLEVFTRDIQKPRHSVHNGQNQTKVPLLTGKRARALLDFGTLHTVVEELTLCHDGVTIIDFSGNYTILDITDNPLPFQLGQKVYFTPSYWSVARACRTPQIPLTVVRDADAGLPVSPSHSRT